MNKKWLVTFVIFSVLTFIISSITCSLTFYSDKKHTKINSDRILVDNGIIKNSLITYYESNTISLNNISPGYTKTYKFDISNINSNEISYDIEWNNINSTWNIQNQDYGSHPEEFVYSLSCLDGIYIDNTTMPFNDKNSKIIENQKLKSNTTNECELTILFKNTGNDQSYNSNKSFTGEYKVNIKE